MVIAWTHAAHRPQSQQHAICREPSGGLRRAGSAQRFICTLTKELSPLLKDTSLVKVTEIVFSAHGYGRDCCALASVNEAACACACACVILRVRSSAEGYKKSEKMHVSRQSA